MICCRVAVLGRLLEEEEIRMVHWVVCIFLAVPVPFWQSRTLLEKTQNKSRIATISLCNAVTVDSLANRKMRKVMILHYADSGRSIGLRLREEIELNLAENPTTGYQWQIVESATPVLEKSGDSFQRGSSQGLGAGGTRIFKFRSRAAGTATLRIVYGRPGVQESIKQEFVLSIRVSEN
jgi:inhibitor of cysteine peptidase